VAAHLEPEILVVDEVLAVGDAEFQKKCLGKMGNVAKEGRTVLFVSHNMQAIRQLCERAVLFQAGELVFNGEASTVVERYLGEAVRNDEKENLEEIIGNLPADPAFRLEGIRLTQNGHPTGPCVESGKPLELEIRYSVLERTTGLRVYFDLCDDLETLLFRSFNDEDGNGIPVAEPGRYLSRVVIPANFLGPVKYEIRVRSTIFNVRSCLPPLGVRLPLSVTLTGKYNRAYLSDTFRGKFALALTWVNNKI